MNRLVLASASKRRRDMLKNTGYEFDVIVPDVDESQILNENLEPGKLVVRLAELKACAVTDKLPENTVIIAADTIVCFNDETLGKPRDKNMAFSMLKKLSGNIHKVYTGVFITQKNNLSDSFYVEASVHMSFMDDDEIKGYINTGQPMDKAGSYGIQGLGGLFITEIHGDFFAIEGLPINKVYKCLKKFSITPIFKNTEYI